MIVHVEGPVDERLLNFQVFRRLSYAQGLFWKCECGDVSLLSFKFMPHLIKSYERHLKMVHNVVPGEAPF